MNFKEYVIFKEAKKNSTKSKKKPEVEEKDVSIDDLKSQLPEVEEKDVSIDDLKSQLPEVEEKDVSIDDLKSQLDDLLLKIQRPSNTYEFILDKNEFIVKAAKYAKKYLNKTFGKKYGKRIDFDDIVSTLGEKLLNFHKQDFNRIETDKVNSAARYLSGILAHSVIDEIRKTRRKGPGGAKHDIRAIDRHIGDKNAPDYDLEKQEDLEKAKAVLDELPDSYQSVVKCLILNDMSYEETAQFLGMKIGAVGSLFSYAKARLKTLMNVEEKKKNQQTPVSSGRVTDAFKSALLTRKDTDVIKPYTMFSGSPSDEEINLWSDPVEGGRYYASREGQRKGIDPTMARVLSEPRKRKSDYAGDMPLYPTEKDYFPDLSTDMKYSRWSDIPPEPIRSGGTYTKKDYAAMPSLGYAPLRKIKVMGIPEPEEEASPVSSIRVGDGDLEPLSSKHYAARASRVYPNTRSSRVYTSENPSYLPYSGLPYSGKGYGLRSPGSEESMIRSPDIDPERSWSSIRIGPEEEAPVAPMRSKVINPEPIDPEAWKRVVHPKFSDYLDKKEQEFQKFLRAKKKSVAINPPPKKSTRKK